MLDDTSFRNIYNKIHPSFLIVFWTDRWRDILNFRVGSKQKKNLLQIEFALVYRDGTKVDKLVYLNLKIIHLIFCYYWEEGGGGSVLPQKVNVCRGKNLKKIVYLN